LAPRLSRALRTLTCGPATHDATERNIWYLYVEVAWAGLLSAAAAFNATFAVRLGASNTMIGWLSALPSLIAVFLLIPAARFLETQSDRKPWMIGSLLIARLGYGLLAVLPWLVHSRRAEAAVWLLIAISVPSAFFSAGWNPLLADVVPERERTRVFAMRNILVSATVATFAFIAGKWLDLSQRISWAAFPANYQVLYMVGFAGAVVSTCLVHKLHVPPSVIVRHKWQSGPGKPALAELRTMLTMDRGFAAIVLNTFLFDCGAWLVAPLYIIFFVRHLGATDAWIGLNSTLANVGVIMGYALWRRWMHWLGYSRALLISAPLGACYAFLVALFPDLKLILLWGILISMINPGLNLSHFNILLKLTPDGHRASYIATFSAIMNAGAFALPMIGVALANLVGIRAVLLIGGSIRLLGAGLFYVNRIRVQEADIR
jgi:MFS family permease